MMSKVIMMRKRVMPTRVGRRWNLGQPFYSSLDPRCEVWSLLIDKVMYDFGNVWHFWRLRLLCMVEEIFLGCELRLKILRGPILHEVIRTDENAGSVVIILQVLFLVLSVRSYHLGL